MLGLSALHVRNFRALRGWTERAKKWSTLRKAWDVAVSFLIPTVILLVVFSQIKAFYDYRFNLTYQLVIMSRALGDIAVPPLPLPTRACTSRHSSLPHWRSDKSWRANCTIPFHRHYMELDSGRASRGCFWSVIPSKPPNHWSIFFRLPTRDLPRCAR